MADVGLGLGLMLVLLLTGWSQILRDLAFRIARGQNYVLALFVYLLFSDVAEQGAWPGH